MGDYVQKRFTVTVKHWERVKTDTGFYTRDLPDTQHEVLVTADLEAIAKRLGPNAVKSKGGKSQEINGLVVVKRL